MLTKYLSFSFFKLYIFLFFLGAQSFLVFWISVTLFKFPPFAIFGLLMYLFILWIEKLLLRSVSGVTVENLAPANKPTSILLPIFIFVLIVAVVAYILVVYWIQNLVITHFGVPAKLFSYVSLSLNAISFILSFWFSFITKR